MTERRHDDTSSCRHPAIFPAEGSRFPDDQVNILFKRRVFKRREALF